MNFKIALDSCLIRTGVDWRSCTYVLERILICMSQSEGAKEIENNEWASLSVGSGDEWSAARSAMRAELAISANSVDWSHSQPDAVCRVFAILHSHWLWKLSAADVSLVRLYMRLFGTQHTYVRCTLRGHFAMSNKRRIQLCSRWTN